MSRRLPFLNALRGFEAAARHLSFTRAADELSLTQGAVSRQVRDLEAHLGVDLFVRRTRCIELTGAGRELARTVQEAFSDIEGAIGALGRRRETHPLTLSILPTLASKWLMPRLHQFTQANRDIDLRVVTSIEPTDLLAHDLGVAIKVGRMPGRRYERAHAGIELEMVADWSGVHADELFPDALVPVCAPSLLGEEALRNVEDVLRYPLIHTSSRRFGWPDWLRCHGVRPLENEQDRLEFGHFFMSIEAARSGRGIALVPDILLSAEQDRNDLVAPLPSAPSAGEYYLLVHETRLADPSVEAFRTWVLTEARAASEAKPLRIA